MNRLNGHNKTNGRDAANRRPTGNDTMQLPTDEECQAWRPNGSEPLIDRELQATIEAEETIVGVLIIDSRAWEHAGDLAADDFVLPRAAVVFATLAKMREEGIPITINALSVELKGRRGHDVDLAYLGKLISDSECQASHAPYFVERIRKAADKRRLIESLKAAQRQVQQGGDAERVRNTLASLKDACTAAMQPRRQCLRVRALPEDEAEYRLATPIIGGIARRGEVVNLIASPKQGKSWLVHNLAISVAIGCPWLGFPVEQGRVLLIDNELHRTTLQHRLRKVATAMNADRMQVRQHVEVLALRGLGWDLLNPGLEAEIADAARAGLNLVVLDALYKFLPEGCDENDNASMGNLYAQIERLAMVADATVVVVHHASKGAQGSRRATDVGAGAGSISRATDAHLVIRDHDEPQAVVIEAVTRTFAEPEPSVWRRQFPLWQAATDLDPTQLRDAGKRKNQGAPAALITAWTAERFVEAFLDSSWQVKASIVSKATNAGLTGRAAAVWIEVAEEKGLIRQNSDRKSKEKQRFQRV